MHKDKLITEYTQDYKHNFEFFYIYEQILFYAYFYNIPR